MTDALQVVTIAASQEEADTIARELVSRRLAACAQVSGPITSTYHWQGKLESGQEWMCTIKTRQAHFAAVAAAIRALHSYEVPEILATAVVAGDRGYLEWLASELADPTGPLST